MANTDSFVINFSSYKSFALSLVAVVAICMSTLTHSEILFEETFDDQPDWTSDDWTDGPAPNASLPQNWTYGIFTGKWSPASGHPDRHPTVEILASNTDKTRNGTGKSYVKWREGSAESGQNNFGSDSVLAKVLDQDYTELYVEFYITLSSELISAYYNDIMGSMKLFRILSHNRVYADKNEFFGEVNSPKFISGPAGSTTYGYRNFLAFYARGPNHSNLPVFGGLGGGSGGDWSGSFLTDLDGMRPDGSDAMLPDKANGGFIDPAEDRVAHIDEVMGPEGTWTKLGYYVKMNSAPGVQDGEVMMWVDDQRIVFSDQIDWVREGWDMRGWNYVAIGGNDLIQGFPLSERHEHWYAIDDLKIATEIPESVLNSTPQITAPNPPSDITIE